MLAGAAHVIVGVPLTAVIVTLVVSGAYDVSVGVKVTDSTRGPDVNAVPAAGKYTNEPGNGEVAFNCDAPSVAGSVTFAGVFHVSAGAPFATLIATVAVAFV